MSLFFDQHVRLGSRKLKIQSKIYLNICYTVLKQFSSTAVQYDETHLIPNRLQQHSFQQYNKLLVSRAAVLVVVFLYSSGVKLFNLHLFKGTFYSEISPSLVSAIFYSCYHSVRV